jgi:hypothetical protein
MLLASAFALSAGATERITVAELEKAVSAAQQLQDKAAADQLADLELTERLTKARFTRMNSQLPGEKSKQALLALADSSAFLDLPAADTLHEPAPDKATQGKIIARATDFVADTVSRMPDFLASRTTTRFQDHKIRETGDGSWVVTDAPMHFKDRNMDTVTFRSGREVAETTSAKNGTHPVINSSAGLSTWGVFGPLLGVVMVDIMNGKIGWGHWEQGPSGPLAVFRYAVSKDRSSYTVRYCCFRSDAGEVGEFEALPAYHGELAIDPATGAVFRLVLKTDLAQLGAESEDARHMDRFDVLVEYGPVAIGGKTCICPVESATISRAEAMLFHGYGPPAAKKINPDDHPGNRPAHPPPVSLPKVLSINDVVFDNYHQFRGEVRILSTDSEDTDAPPAAPATAPKAPPTQ